MSSSSFSSKNAQLPLCAAPSAKKHGKKDRKDKKDRKKDRKGKAADNGSALEPAKAKKHKHDDDNWAMPARKKGKGGKKRSQCSSSFSSSSSSCRNAGNNQAYATIIKECDMGIDSGSSSSSSCGALPLCGGENKSLGLGLGLGQGQLPSACPCDSDSDSSSSSCTSQPAVCTQEAGTKAACSLKELQRFLKRNIGQRVTLQYDARPPASGVVLRVCADTVTLAGFEDFAGDAIVSLCSINAWSQGGLAASVVVTPVSGDSFCLGAKVSLLTCNFPAAFSAANTKVTLAVGSGAPAPLRFTVSATAPDTLLATLPTTAAPGTATITVAQTLAGSTTSATSEDFALERCGGLGGDLELTPTPTAADNFKQSAPETFSPMHIATNTTLYLGGFISLSEGDLRSPEFEGATPQANLAGPDGISIDLQTTPIADANAFLRVPELDATWTNKPLTLNVSVLQRRKQTLSTFTYQVVAAKPIETVGALAGASRKPKKAPKKAPKKKPTVPIYPADDSESDSDDNGAQVEDEDDDDDDETEQDGNDAKGCPCVQKKGRCDCGDGKGKSCDCTKKLGSCDCAGKAAPNAKPNAKPHAKSKGNPNKKAGCGCGS